MVYRVYVERKNGFDYEAKGTLEDIRSFLGIDALKGVRLINRYDVEDIEESLFAHAKTTVFSEPQTDDIISWDDIAGGDAEKTIFAVEYLPGQFDQRADSAAQCIQLISQGERPEVKTARVYVLEGNLSAEEVNRIKQYVINPVESREASLDLPNTLKVTYETPDSVADIVGFRAFDEEELHQMLSNFGLAMDYDDLIFCQQYFREEERDPSITEIRMIDTYWSDHCRHTTFTTTLDHITFEDEEVEKTYEAYLKTREELHRTKPVTLMDIGTIAARCLRAEGKLSKLDESEEINACTVKIEIEVDGKKEPWLLLFKNETHNHPTEIEPFGGAATCIGGAIRDPLSGRSYVYAAMRLTGAANPLTPLNETMEGKLPQKKLVSTAAAGYASYGNQIGLATGIVDEIYHPGYAAKHMEVGAVIAAAPAENVRRERPEDGDYVILLGGRTGRDGCGGATGSSKSHTVESLESCGAEVQKGNAPEERKLQRLFRNPEASRMIKRCNDFGAGGVSVAVGELADGLDIDLDAVPKKYEGLDGTELAISESQERMAVVVEEKDVDAFKALAAKENLEATVIARVTENPRLVMRWKGNTIVDISRAFLNTNGAEKHADVLVEKGQPYEKEIPADFATGMKALADDIRTCSRRGLSERFDSTIGCGTVLMPFGGKYQRTPIQSMVHKISLEEGHTDDVSYMAWGFNPEITDVNPYQGAYLAVVESVSKLVATGASMEDVYLSFQEYFGRLRDEDKRWGKPAAALLGAYRAQMELGIAAIGGKDSMSGSFEDLDVPNTLISFAVTTGKEKEVVSPEWKEAGHKVCLLQPETGEDGLPKAESLLELYDQVHELLSSGKAVSAYTAAYGGVAEAIFKMSLGNRIGVALEESVPAKTLFGYSYGSFILEMAEEEIPAGSMLLGTTTDEYALSYQGGKLPVEELETAYEAKLESIYPCNLKEAEEKIEAFSFETTEVSKPAVKVAKPRVLIPVFPGTNCEYDSARAAEEAGAEAEIFIIRNLTSEAIAQSAEDFTKSLANAQMLFIPGGFSGGDEPDGSGKFITAFLRGEAVKEGVMKLLDEREGLILGVCNGFQALVKLGLLPYGKIMDMDENCPTLTFNKIGRHQSKIVRSRIASNLSPWLKKVNVGDIVSAPISHGEGRFVASDELIRELAAKGQIATQYVDLNGNPTYDIQYNPNHSTLAIEGITSPDGRVFGKMGHAERVGKGLYKNVPGNYDIRMFEAAVEYFR